MHVSNQWCVKCDCWNKGEVGAWREPKFSFKLPPLQKQIHREELIFHWFAWIWYWIWSIPGMINAEIKWFLTGLSAKASLDCLSAHRRALLHHSTQHHVNFGPPHFNWHMRSDWQVCRGYNVMSHIHKWITNKFKVFMYWKTKHYIWVSEVQKCKFELPYFMKR